MSRWFRHYAGMMRDEKLVAVALRAKQPIERVVWVWGAILESAAEINDGGHFDFDADEAAYFLRVDVTECNAIVTALVEKGRVTGDRISNWDKRQFKSDDSSDRVRKHREKKAEEKQGASELKCNEDETLRNAPETETETETETEKEKDAPTDGAPRLSVVQDPPPRTEAEHEKDFFERGKKILGAKSGGLLKKLLVAKGNVALARASIELASTKADPREYIGAIVRGRDSPEDLRARGEAW